MTVPTPADREPELVQRARRGDEDAFEALVALHADRVYRALRGFGLEASEADEVAQEVFLRAWRGLDRFEGRARLSTWLYRIAFNEAKRRLAQREPPAAAPRPAADEDPLAAIPDAPGREPAAQAAAHEFEAMLDRALATLPADQRAAVVLRDLEGLSTDEAARVTGTREPAFKSRLHRGRMQLRALLEPYLDREAA